MTWDVVVAALGGSAITAIFSYFANAQNNKTAFQRASEENNARLEQLREEHRNQLHKEVMQRRTDYRRDRLRPLQEALGKLLAVSAKYRYAAGGITAREVGVEVYVPPDIDQEFREATAEIRVIRRDVVGSYSWLGAGGPKLAELVQKLNGHLQALEREAEEFADNLTSSKTTRERADAASKEIDGTLTEMGSLIEELISGTDLLAQYLESPQAIS